MSVCRKLPDGTIQKIAGHTILLDANAQEVREGTINIPAYYGEPRYHELQVTFSDPMPDTDYAVDWNVEQSAYWAEKEIKVGAKTTTGFKLYITIDGTGDSPVGTILHYIAWKPVKIEGYTELQNKINNPDDTPTIDSMNLVTSDGVARAIENASAVWKGTRAEWNALPAADKVKYDLAVLLDQTLVKAIDRTDGTETNVADLSGQFVGTHAEWEAETNKTQYKTAVLTDDRKTVNEVTSTGALNEVADDARIWRGTKEEWEALTDTEKDEWDQAEIETIEAQGLNPFRTLSDPETLSIAPNTDYTCPHDGFITCATVNSGVNMILYINGVQYVRDESGGTERSAVTIPVQKGDIFKYNTEPSEALRITARWYTTDINPGNPMDYPVVHRSQSLDWDNKVNIATAVTSSAGYTCPSDGYIICGDLPDIGHGDSWLYVNDIKVGYGTCSTSTSSYAGFNVQMPVQKGDVVKSPSGLRIKDSTFFVPYKDYPDYSTTEHWTGRRWIDGKKIYSKVFTGLSFNGSQSTWVNTGAAVSGLERVIECKGWREDSSMGLIYYTCENYDSAGALYIHGKTDGLNPINCLYVEYTKTTD